MKKVKQISLGDKVFAKVKGYPAWPARVDEDLGTGKRFKVFFYGTGETGLVKSEDLFSYVEHKEQFVKSLKRKDYNDAIEEIEAAIAQDLLDQDDVILDEPEEFTLQPTSETEKDEEVKRGLKRKLSVDSTTESRKKKTTAGPKSSKTDDRIKSTDGTVELSDEENELEYPEKSNNNREHKTHEESSSEEEDFEAKKDTTPTKFKIVTPQTLRDIIEEFEHCVKDAEKGNEKPEDDANLNVQNEILLARLTPDQYIGIKLNQNRPDKIETEIERLRWKESDARTALELKEKVEDGSLKPDDKPELFEFELELTENQLQEAVKNRIMERKRTKLKFLKIEATLVELDAAIKTNLALDKADPKEALKDLNTMSSLNVGPLMLKKHSHVMEMVKRLRRYIGNVKEWKLEGKELEDFKKDAEQIRAKADVVYAKFKSLFQVPSDKSFWEVFNGECENFKNLTKDMTENQIFILCAEPGTKQARWDELDDQEELKLINERYEKKIQDKENSSQVINSEENFADLSAENSNLTHTSTDSHG